MPRAAIKADAQTTTVIGTLHFSKDSKEILPQDENSCFDISGKGELIMTNCFQNSDVRYWCHVFLEGENLRRSFEDLEIPTESAYGMITIF